MWANMGRAGTGTRGLNLRRPFAPVRGNDVLEPQALAGGNFVVLVRAVSKKRVAGQLDGEKVHSLFSLMARPLFHVADAWPY